jgi:hypothetical protein
VTLAYWYHDEHMKVSIVSVSRTASPPHCGQVACMYCSENFSAFSPVDGSCKSVGSTTGSSSYGTGTVPHCSQKSIGMGAPQ